MSWQYYGPVYPIQLKVEKIGGYLDNKNNVQYKGLYNYKMIYEPVSCCSTRMENAIIKFHHSQEPVPLILFYGNDRLSTGCEKTKDVNLNHYSMSHSKEHATYSYTYQICVGAN